eukprot:TRINITY_DN1720_c0_g1::TRINITY_DN1720_c0_g1_i1::g.25208::m.25208 TRINITY_DN1720_c0_g1::TRINITY_DN1720_c0_g1_i1::g.25208  ORF type:complete len:731 (+),score=107.57,DUF3456/PF11938.3/0.28,DUF3456/PF11938.3/3.3e+02,PH_11/PF15413.1/3.5e+02,PH_11/PF15413.1/3.1e+03,PH_11/PF15413.1/0.53 TRINITY_DN1720_c0_g1_i1:271-2193(+)
MADDTPQLTARSDRSSQNGAVEDDPALTPYVIRSLRVASTSSMGSSRGGRHYDYPNGAQSLSQSDDFKPTIQESIDDMIVHGLTSPHRVRSLTRSVSPLTPRTRTKASPSTSPPDGPRDIRDVEKELERERELRRKAEWELRQIKQQFHDELVRLESHLEKERELHREAELQVEELTRQCEEIMENAEDSTVKWRMAEERAAKLLKDRDLLQHRLTMATGGVPPATSPSPSENEGRIAQAPSTSHTDRLQARQNLTQRLADASLSRSSSHPHPHSHSHSHTSLSATDTPYGTGSLSPITTLSPSASQTHLPLSVPLPSSSSHIANASSSSSSSSSNTAQISNPSTTHTASSSSMSTILATAASTQAPSSSSSTTLNNSNLNAAGSSHHSNSNSHSTSNAVANGNTNGNATGPSQSHQSSSSSSLFLSSISPSSSNNNSSQTSMSNSSSTGNANANANGGNGNNNNNNNSNNATSASSDFGYTWRGSVSSMSISSPNLSGLGGVPGSFSASSLPNEMTFKVQKQGKHNKIWKERVAVVRRDGGVMFYSTEDQKRPRRFIKKSELRSLEICIMRVVSDDDKVPFLLRLSDPKQAEVFYTLVRSMTQDAERIRARKSLGSSTSLARMVETADQPSTLENSTLI